MSIGYASIYLENEKCVGCTRCMQRCPTEAIRIRDGKATILRERCVDCGECIRVCPRHAMKARVDTLSEALGKYKYTIALPAQALYGQFPGVRTRAPILEGLLRIGFDSVFEVAAAAEVMSAVTHYELNYGSIPHPIITTDCPVILRIVRIRFPSLLPHLLNYRSPMEVAARWSKRLAMKETGLSEEDIGCVYISPCPAKCAGAKAALGTARPAITGVVSIAEVAPRLTAVMGDIDDHERYAQAGAAGVSWAISGGQSSAAGEPNHLAASGIENIIGILEALEDGKLSHVDLIELNACYPGCVGGALTVENPFIARTQMERLMKQFAPVLPPQDIPLDDLSWDDPVEFEPVMQLDSNIVNAMDKLSRIKELEEHFNGMDCGACGAPSCRALAEDIVGGFASEDQCIFLIREKLQKLLDQMPKEKASEEENAK